MVAQHKGDWDLYDLEADRTELTDQAAKQPEKVKELAALYEQWTKRANVAPWDEVQKAKAKP